MGSGGCAATPVLEPPGFESALHCGVQREAAPVRAVFELVEQRRAGQLIDVGQDQQVVRRACVRGRRRPAGLLQCGLDAVEGLLAPAGVQRLVELLAQRGVPHHDVHDLAGEGGEPLRVRSEDERLARAAVRHGRLDDHERVHGGVELMQPQLQHVQLVRERDHVDDARCWLASWPRLDALEPRRRPFQLPRRRCGRAEDEALQVLLHAGEEVRRQPARVGAQSHVDGRPGEVGRHGSIRRNTAGL